MMNAELSSEENRQQRMYRLLSENLDPLHLIVENESPNHHVPKNSETHFKVILVSDKFNDLSLVKRHQLVYRCLNDEFADGLHALSLILFSPMEWTAQGHSIPDSPRCRGGHDRSDH